MVIERELIESCKKKDRRAQNILYKCCFSFLMKVCYRYAHNEDDAVSLLNHGFLKILNNIEKYKPEIPFEVWSRRVVINAIIDEYRKNKEYHKTIQSTDLSEIHETESTFNTSEIDSKISVDEIISLIRELPPMSSKVFNLYVMDGYTHKEIALMLNISEGTSKWHLSFAREKLRDKLKTSINIIIGIIILTFV